MRPVVHRVDVPFVAGAVVRGIADAVDHRIAHVHVRRRHVDLGPQHVLAVFEFTRFHALEQVEALLHRAIAPGAFAPRLGQGPAVGANVIGGELFHIGFAGTDQVQGVLVQLLEVIRGMTQLVPLESEPAHVLHDGQHEVFVFLERIGVVETQVGAAAELGRDAEIQADRLGMTDVQVTVGLGRKAGDDLVVFA